MNEHLTYNKYRNENWMKTSPTRDTLKASLQVHRQVYASARFCVVKLLVGHSDVALLSAGTSTVGEVKNVDRTPPVTFVVLQRVELHTASGFAHASVDGRRHQQNIVLIASRLERFELAVLVVIAVF